MIQLSPTSKIYLSVGFIDFRKGIDGLFGYCRNELSKDPFSGAVFVFRNRTLSAVKMLAYDGQGFWLMQKRLSKGKFKWWPESQDHIHQINIHELQVFLSVGNPDTANIGNDWKKIY